ncbi:MAG: TIGR01440 family protein [Bacteroides sp.]
MANGIATENIMNLNEIRQQTISVACELFEAAHPEKDDILVVGCSSSEVAKHRIGTFSSEEIGSTIFKALLEVCQKNGIFLAAQCCEHLNRALIIEKSCAKLYRLPIVNVLPQLKAGGSFATAAFNNFTDPVAVESIQANAGIDIGDTLIGMHLAPVAVPVRTATASIGSAHVVCARTRAKYIGGERACYNEALM